ncbi:cystathionine beta-synthase-like [Pectinophora gossypiella]|uniref:cystathionine beta-synthase-like n=1 Tax=Pectinophora gossypiella TaxID=13191 RepID=UPI00214DF94C|nr:cystathionine beta-synthase-like [Pectinophora gossypiella]
MSDHVDPPLCECVPRHGEPYFDLVHMSHESQKPFEVRKKQLSSVLDLIGVTPLIKLNKIPKSEGIKCDMYVKLEYENPAGSIKDRIALRMVTEAEKQGLIKPGVTTLIEPTSGNTGIGIALVAAIKGYKCILVIPDKNSDEKVNTILALGAKVVKTPTDVPFDDPESDIEVAKKLHKKIPNSFILDQFNNPVNPLAHFDGTAEEILWSLDGKVDMVVMGAGTSGTVSGTAYKIKLTYPDCIVIGVDPKGSILAPGNTEHIEYEVEGIGDDFCPDVLYYEVINDWVQTVDYDSFTMARRLIREEGILCGGSSGAAVWAGIQAAKKKGLKEGQKCVVVLPDGIRNYMSKFISDPWMELRYFKLTPDNKHCQEWWYKNLMLKDIQPICSVQENWSMEKAVDTLLSYKPSATVAAVINNDKFITGLLPVQETLNRLENQYKLDDPLKKFIVKRYKGLYMSNEPTLGAVFRALKIEPYVLILDRDDPKHRVKALGLITTSIMLRIISAYYATKTIQKQDA